MLNIMRMIKIRISRVITPSDNVISCLRHQRLSTKEKTSSNTFC